MSIINLTKEEAHKQLIDLSKKAEEAIQRKSMGDQKARVALVLDISGSMSGLYRSGVVQQTLDRILALSMNFDDNQAVDVFLFGEKAYSIGEVTPDNFYGFVEKEINRKRPLEGATRYGVAIHKLIGVMEKGTQQKRSFFGLRKAINKLPVEPAYVLFVTDGNCGDEDETSALMKEVSSMPYFWQFIGLGRTNAFPFLQSLDEMEGRTVDNAGFFAVGDIATMKDEELYDKMLHEFPGWLDKAKTAGILK